VVKLTGQLTSLLCVAIAALAISGCQKRSEPINAPVAGIVLRSERISLPASTRKFSGGPAAGSANNFCLMCHSEGMVTTQPPLALAVWKTEVAKMIKVYGCPLPGSEVDRMAQFMYEQNNPGTDGRK
jgi:hypothetical protein